MWRVSFPPGIAGRSGWGRGGRVRRNCTLAATGRWWARRRFVAADAVVIKLRPGDVGFHPLVPEGSVRVLVAVAHSQTAVAPLAARAVALRDVRLVRVWRVSAGKRSRRRKR